MKDFLYQRFVVSWRTTVVGLISAVAFAIYTYVSSGGHLSMSAIGLVALIGLVGGIFKEVNAGPLGMINGLIVKHGEKAVLDFLNDTLKKESLVKVATVLLLVGMIAVGLVSTSEAQITSPVAGDFVGVGASLNPGATPLEAGSAFYCHALSDTNCVLGTIDALPSTKPNFNLRTNIGSGEAHRFLVLVNGRLEVWGTVGVGLTYTTENLGWNFESGGLIGYQIKPNSPWRVFVAARLEKASVGGANYRPAITGGLIRKF